MFIRSAKYFPQLEAHGICGMIKDWFEVDMPCQTQLRSSRHHQRLVKYVRPLQESDVEKIVTWLKNGKWKTLPHDGSGIIHCGKNTTNLPLTITISPAGVYLDKKRCHQLGYGGSKNVTKALFINQQGIAEKCAAYRFRDRHAYDMSKHAQNILKKHGLINSFSGNDFHTYQSKSGKQRFKSYVARADDDLRTYISKKDNFTTADSIEVIEQLKPIAHQLQQWHSKGVAHRDIKLENIFIQDNNFQIGDIEGIIDSPENGGICTLDYLMPIRFLQENASLLELQYADVFALGITFAKILRKESFGEYLHTVRFVNRTKEEFKKSIRERIIQERGLLSESKLDTLVISEFKSTMVKAHADLPPCERRSSIAEQLSELIIDMIHPVSTISMSAVMARLNQIFPKTDNT